MKKRILHNWALKLASLLLAFILWFLVVQIDDPSDSTTFYNIPVTLKNTELLEKENKVYEVLDNTDSIRVTVRAPRSVIKSLRSSDIVAEADMSRLTEVNTIAINLAVPNAEVDSVTSNPDVLRLSVEEKASKWIRVQYGTVGEVAEGYMVSSASADQTIIEVSGPKSAVERIGYAGIEIDVSGATTSLSANVETLLYDAEGNQLDLPSVTKNVNYVHMSVEVLATKEVPIELNVMGEPAEGYLATGIVECDPSTVKIAGTAGTLAGISKISIPAEKLDITGASEDLISTINLKEYLSALNVRLADSSFNGRITATVYIEPEYTKTFEIPESSISVINVPEGLEAILPDSEEPYMLVVSGLETVVTALQQNAIRGTADVTAWMEEEGHTEIKGKTYSIPVTFQLGDDITIKEETAIKITFKELEE
ncbi:MAG: YbbR-like domain-containing protein [Acetatifactor sp.]